MQTVRGQCLDLITAPSGGKVDFSDFTEDRYNAIVKWKTGYYSFYLPVALAMYMVGCVEVYIPCTVLCYDKSYLQSYTHLFKLSCTYTNMKQNQL